MSEITAPSIDSATLLDLTARIVSAYAGNATLSPSELTDVIGSVSRALSQLSSATVEPEPLTRDPFDRLLLAQCQIEGLRLVTIDRALVSHAMAAKTNR